MPVAAILLVASDASADELDGWKEVARDFAQASGSTVRVMTGDEAALTTLASDLSSRSALWTEQALAIGAPPPSPMTAAAIQYRDDGRPDWGAMWTTFCELALYGGPPHRGPEDPLGPTFSTEQIQPGFDPIAEIRRGIFETTALFSEPAEPGWLAITCHGSRMAAWLCASIILENIEARCEGERLFVPADQSFRLADQVKSVVTVVAKTNHYWAAHVAAVGRP